MYSCVLDTNVVNLMEESQLCGQERPLLVPGGEGVLPVLLRKGSVRLPSSGKFASGGCLGSRRSGKDLGDVRGLRPRGGTSRYPVALTSLSPGGLRPRDFL